MRKGIVFAALSYAANRFPWIGVTLALTAGSYDLMRKLAALGPFAVEGVWKAGRNV